MSSLPVPVNRAWDADSACLTSKSTRSVKELLSQLVKVKDDPDSDRIHDGVVYAVIEADVAIVPKYERNDDEEGDDAERGRKTSARDILRDLQGFSGRLHLLYGGRDPESAGSRAFFEAWCRRQRIAVDVRVIDGAPHNFYTAAWTEAVAAQTADWLFPA